MKPFGKIVRLLEKNSIPYQILEHEAVFTSEEAAAVQGMPIEQGAKSLLFKANDAFVMVVLPGNKRVDSKKLKEILGTKRLRFATPQEVIHVMGCEIGSCYPLGNIINVIPYVDESLSIHKVISFNPGIHTKSMSITWADYQKLAKPKIVKVIQ